MIDRVVLSRHEVMADILKGPSVKEAVATGHAKIEKIRDKFESK